MYSRAATSPRNLPFPPVAVADTAPTLADLVRDQPVESIAAGAALVWQGEEAAHIFGVLEGVVRVYRVTPDGRRAIMGFLHPGDVLGVSLLERYLFSAEAVTEVKVRRFRRGRFFAMINESPALRPQLFALLCDEMTAAQDQMLLLCRKTAEERVVSFLLAIHRKSGKGREIALPMSRQDMADYLGLTMETVSRMMTSLTRRDLIALGPRHAVTLRNLPALREIAGQDDGAEPRESPSRRAVWPH